MLTALCFVCARRCGAEKWHQTCSSTSRSSRARPRTRRATKRPRGSTSSIHVTRRVPSPSDGRADAQRTLFRVRATMWRREMASDVLPHISNRVGRGPRTTRATKRPRGPTSSIRVTRWVPSPSDGHADAQRTLFRVRATMWRREMASEVLSHISLSFGRGRERQGLRNDLVNRHRGFT